MGKNFVVFPTSFGRNILIVQEIRRQNNFKQLYVQILPKKLLSRINMVVTC